MEAQHGEFTTVNKRDGKTARRWHAEINNADGIFKEWRERAEKVINKYRDEEGVLSSSNTFNILYSNTQTLAPAIYARTPAPDVRRRFRDDQPVAREVSEVLERAISYHIDAFDVDSVLRDVRMDYLLPGLATARVRYVPVMQERDLPPYASVNQETGVIEMMEGETEEVLVGQEAPIEYTYWKDVLFDPTARRWEDVRWVAFRHFFTKDEFEEQFDDVDSESVPFNFDASGDDTVRREAKDDVFARTMVWEVWDKDTREVLFISDGKALSPLSVEEDPLRLQGFFPCPRPMVACSTTGSIIPVPLYTLYQEQAQELSRISARIERVTEALKLRGVYDQTIGELSNLLEGDDNTLEPVNMSVLTERGGIQKAVEMFDIEPQARVLINLYQAREQIKQTIYEITGISDIIRGSSNASETATAQRIKGQFGTLRLQDMQRDMQRFARDLMRLQAEVIAEHFEPHILQMMTGKQITPEMMLMMRSDAMRGFNVDIETDSTIQADEAAEQEAAVKLLSAVPQFLQGVAPFVQTPANPMGVIPLEAAKELLMVGVRRFKGVRAFEEALEMLGTDMQPPPQPQPDPIEVGKLQEEQKRTEIDAFKAQTERMNVQQSNVVDMAQLQQQRIMVNE